MATISNGALTQIVVTDAGSGYTGNPIVAISPPPSNRAATAAASVVNGFVVSITVTDGGLGYTASPLVTISGGGGSGAMAVATIVNGVVNQIVVQNAGKGYTSTPTVIISAPHSPKPPFSDGLVAYYPFNGNADDASGQGNNGIVKNATLTVDRFGSPAAAFDFNGTSSYITIPQNPVLNSLQNMTVSAWILARRIYDTVQIVDKASSGFPDGWMFDIINNYTPKVPLLRMQGANISNPYNVMGTTELSLLKWYHVVSTISGSVGRVYLNGYLNGTGDVDNIPSNTLDIWIGSGHPSTRNPIINCYFNGLIDDIRIYNRAMSDQEVQDLYYYEAPEQPWVTLKVKTVQVTMHVKPTKKYQLEASLDLKTWTNIGQPFVATSSEVDQEFNAIEVGRYFKLSEVQ